MQTSRSAARLYWENKLGSFTPKGVKIPVVASAFPDELFQAPKSWTEQAYPNLIRYTKLSKGGHFAAWEQPKFLSMKCGPASERSGRDTVPADSMFDLTMAV